MLLLEARSRCSANQINIVSKDSGSSCKHIATNNSRKKVRQYKLDGEIIINEKTCDYLVLNDEDKKAFFIELKGCNITEAFPQFEGAVSKLKNELSGYSYNFRIIATRVGPHTLSDSNCLRFKRKYGANRLVIKVKEYNEKID